MSTKLDFHAQPEPWMNHARRVNRATQELIGFLRGILADGKITTDECDQLAKWLVGNREIADLWPVNVLVQRIDQIYKDGVADEHERAELAVLAQDIVGKQDDDTFLFGPTDLPLTKPVPDVIFDRNEFVLTGRFLFGTRKNCQKAIETRGGRCSETVHLQTSYLVVGTLMSRDWKFSSFGTKILKAVEYTARCPIAIISEQHWESFLGERKSDSRGN